MQVDSTVNLVQELLDDSNTANTSFNLPFKLPENVTFIKPDKTTYFVGVSASTSVQEQSSQDRGSFCVPDIVATKRNELFVSLSKYGSTVVHVIDSRFSIGVRYLEIRSIKQTPKWTTGSDRSDCRAGIAYKYLTIE